MSDNLKPEDRRRTMQSVKGRNTKIEKRIFSLLAGMGLKGWKKNAVEIIGKPDIAFIERRVAIFIDGCFWHGCPDCKRPLPKTNRDYWERKIHRNIALAESYNEKLRNEGWTVLRFWEHEISNSKKIKSQIEKALGSRSHKVDERIDEIHQIFNRWLESCIRNRKISRNTVAMGIVVLDRLQRECPVSREEVISQGGEVSGARSGLGAILESYEIPKNYLKEITTRQGHQDGQRLFTDLEWGKKFSFLSNQQRKTLINELIEKLRNYANDWLKRQNLKLDIDRRQAPSTWMNIILENAKGRSGGIVEQQLIGAKLERRFKEISIANYPAHAGDKQTERVGDFSISKMVYHITAAPSRQVLQKCSDNLKAGLHPILLIPRNQENKTRILAQDEGIDQSLSIITIEDFIAVNIIELATEEKKDFFSILKEIIDIYNRRLQEVETDLSLLIEVR